MHIAQNWRLNKQRYTMVGVRCEKCSEVTFPPREVCPACREAELRASQTVIYEFPTLETQEAFTLQRAGR